MLKVSKKEKVRKCGSDEGSFLITAVPTLGAFEQSIRLDKAASSEFAEFNAAMELSPTSDWPT